MPFENSPDKLCRVCKEKLINDRVRTVATVKPMVRETVELQTVGQTEGRPLRSQFLLKPEHILELSPEEVFQLINMDC